MNKGPGNKKIKWKRLLSPGPWRRITSVLMAIVVFLTTYMMILPALTINLDTALDEPGMYVASADPESEEPASAGSSSGDIGELLTDHSEAVIETAQTEFVNSEVSAGIEEDSGNLQEDLEAAEYNEETAPLEDTIIPSDFDANVPEGETNYYDEAIPELPGSGEENISEGQSEELIPSDEFAETETETSFAEQEVETEGLPSEEQETIEDAAEQADLFTGEPENDEDTALVHVLNAEGTDYRVHVSYPNDAEIPEGAELRVTEILSDEYEYDRYVNEAANTLSTEKRIMSVDNARFFDITILDGEVPVEPKVPVTVVVELADSFAASEDAAVLHYKEDEVLVIDTVDPAEAAANIAADAEADAVLSEGEVIGQEEPGIALEETYGVTPEEAAAIGEETYELTQEEISAANEETYELTPEEISAANEETYELTPEEAVTISEEAYGMKTEDTLMIPEEFGTAEFETAETAETTEAAEPTEEFALDETMNPIAFVADSFSVYGFVTTTLEKGILASNGHNYTVTMTYGADADIPEGAELHVEEVAEDAEMPDGTKYADAAAEALGIEENKTVKTGLFDIYLTVDGEKIQPKAPVHVTIALDDAKEAEETVVVHFSEAGPEVPDQSAEEGNVSFETDGFSVFAVLYTKDAKFEAGGKIGVTNTENVGVYSGHNLVVNTQIDTIEAKGTRVTLLGQESGILVSSWYKVTYEKNGEPVTGYVESKYIDIPEMAEPVTGENDAFKVTASWEKGVLPEGTVLEPGEPSLTEEERKTLESKALKALPVSSGKKLKVTDIRFFDLSFMADGAEVEPNGEVNVSMQLKQSIATEEDESLHLVHFKTEATELLENTVFTKDDNQNLTGLDFTVGSFSTFAIVKTKTLVTQYITANGDTYTITVTYDEDAEIPENAKLEVSELVNDNKEFTDYVEQAAKALAKGEEIPFVNAARLFDISIMADGRKVNPKVPVEVKITYTKAQNLSESGEVGTVHFKESASETETEVMDVDVQGEEGKVEGVTFTTDSFSIYAVIIIDKEAGTFVVEDDDYKVTITYTKEANIPVGTELTVESIDPESTKYAELWKQTIEKINEGVEWTNQDEPDPRKGLTDAIFLDITLNYQGEKFEPEVPLGVKIECKNGGVLTPPNEEPIVIHFADQGTELISDVQTESIERDMPYLTGVLRDSSLTNTFVYEQDGFSIVGAATTGEYIDINENNISGAPIHLMAAQPGLSSIRANKTVEDTDGDGVYELALNVTGASDSSTSTKVDKSNIVIVVDVSGSMSRSTYSTYTYSADTYDSNTTYYRKNDNGNQTCFYLTPGYYYDYGTYLEGGWYYEQGRYLYSYSGTVYTRQTQLEATKAALSDMIDALLSNNKPAGTVAADGTKLDDIIEISLVKFAYANDEWGYSGYEYTHFNGTETLVRDAKTAEPLKNAIDKLWAGGGTNWERALNVALSEADRYKAAQPDENTAVIFLTDGVPTSWGTTNVEGSETRDNTHTGWDRASDDARAIVNNGHTLYDIFSYGSDTVKYSYDGGRTDADYLRSLTNYAYSGSGTYANTDRSTQYVRDYFFNAKDTTALTEAFRKIIRSITNEVGYGGVDVEDGVTLGVTSTSVTVDGTVHDETFRYTVRNGNNIVYSVKIDDGVATFTIAGKEGTYTDDSAETVTTIIDQNDRSKDIISTVYSVEVDGTTYSMSPAIINKETGLVDWDLAGLGILEDDYTYTVAFDVWPNQYSYDIVADLNNGLKTLDQIKADLIEKYGEEKGTAVYNQILTSLLGPDANGQYSILTNWKQEVNYYTVDTTSDDQGHETTTYTPHDPKVLSNPDPIALTSKPVPMVKVWKSNLSPDQIGNLLYKDYPTNNEPTEYRVTLHLWKADTANELQNLINQYAGDPTTASANDYIEKTLGWNGTEYDWDDSVSIAPGTMISLQTAIDMGLDTTSAEHQKNIVTYNGAQYYIIETGHYYSVTEDNIDWHFELETVLYHPMKVDGILKNVTFITDQDGNITGVNDIEDMTQVTATNSKTAELDITKKVVDNTGKMTQSQMDAETFTYKVTLTVPKDADMSHTNALEWVARYNDDPSASNRYIVYGYQASEGTDIRGLEDDVNRFDKKVYGQYTVSYPGGTATLEDIFTNDSNGTTKSGTIYITLMQNEVIRFTNLPSGTQYRIEEMYNNLYQANPSQDNYANLGGDAPASNVEANGYTVTINTKNGNPTVSGRVVTGAIDKLNKRYYNQFTNTLADTAVVDLDVTKHLQGYEWKGDRYYMKLETAEKNTPLPRITTRYLSANSGTNDVTFNFGSVHLKPGTYTYTISETDSKYEKVLSGTIVNGITYDPVKTIKVIVSNDLSITIAEDSSEGVTYDSTTNTIKTKVTNRATPLSIYKFGGSGQDDIENKLAGVQFKLYSDAALTQQVTVDARGNAIGNNGLITTGEDGTASLGILKVGNYYLVETGLGNNPGYISATNPIKIVVDSRITYKQTGWSPSEKYSSDSAASDLVKANGGMFINYADDGTTIEGYTFTIFNSTGAELPSTGGPGTLLIYLSGLMLMALSAMGLLLRRHRNLIVK